MNISEVDTKNILEKIDSLKKDLQAYSDNIWNSINNHNSKEVQQICEFQTEFNNLIKPFNKATSDLCDFISNYLPKKSDEKVQEERVVSDNHKIITELNKNTPHSLDEDFTNTKPFAFIIEGEGYSGFLNWTDVYINFCKVLAKRNPNLIKTLADNPKYFSGHNNKYYSSTEKTMFKSEKIIDGFYVEINFSASNFIKRMKEILAIFEISYRDVTIFLREERV